MTFWSSQKIEANLKRLTDHPDKDMVDCNALTLRVGGEVYVTPGLEQPAPNLHTKTLLNPNQPIPIPPGQFAFLLTEERITIPAEQMGFISVVWGTLAYLATKFVDAPIGEAATLAWSSLKRLL